jgi:hypothetical protein
VTHWTLVHILLDSLHALLRKYHLLRRIWIFLWNISLWLWSLDIANYVYTLQSSESHLNVLSYTPMLFRVMLVAIITAKCQTPIFQWLIKSSFLAHNRLSVHQSPDQVLLSSVSELALHFTGYEGPSTTEMGTPLRWLTGVLILRSGSAINVLILRTSLMTACIRE